jgi:hypothetical protein
VDVSRRAHHCVVNDGTDLDPSHATAVIDAG